MKKKNFKTALACGFVLIALIGIAFCLVELVKTTPKYAPDEDIIIEEVDSNLVPLRAVVLNIKTREISTPENNDELDPLVATIALETEEFERIMKGDLDEVITEGENLIYWALHEDEMEWCHMTEDKEGNLIEHYHTVGDTVVPSEDCQHQQTKNSPTV